MKSETTLEMSETIASEALKQSYSRGAAPVITRCSHDGEGAPVGLVPLGAQPGGLLVLADVDDAVAAGHGLVGPLVEGERESVQPGLEPGQLGLGPGLRGSGPR